MDVTVFDWKALLVQDVNIVLLAALGCLLFLGIRAIKSSLREKNAAPKEKQEPALTLCMALKQHRLACRMTQEAVAEVLGVSRQAVSKWESGASEPSRANLTALAKLYGVSPEALMREVR